MKPKNSLTISRMKGIIKEELSSIRELMSMPDPEPEESVRPTSDSVWEGLYEILTKEAEVKDLKDVIDKMLQDRNDEQMDDIKEAGFFGINSRCQASLAKGKFDMSCLVAYVGAVVNFYENGTEPWLEELRSWSESNSD